MPGFCEVTNYGACVCGKRYARVVRTTVNPGGSVSQTYYTPIADQSEAAAVSRCECGKSISDSWRLSSSLIPSLGALHA
jgi:hypothetical protein